MHRMLDLLGALALSAAILAPVARAEEGHGDWFVASTASGGGDLAVDYDFETVVGVDFDATLTGLLPPGWTGYSSTDPGFDTLEADEPGEGFFRLPAGTVVTMTITAIDPTVALFFPVPAPTTLTAVGQTYVLGTQDAAPPNDIHHHGDLRLILMLPADQAGSGSFSFTLSAPGFGTSEPYTVTLSNTHLFIDFAAGAASDNLKCQKAVGKGVSKFLGLYSKTLYKCLDKVSAVVSAEEQGQPTEAAEAQADKACGDVGGTLSAQATLLGRLAGVAQKTADGIAKACGSAFDADKIARHLNKAACDVQFLASQGYVEAHVVLAEITSGGTPVAEQLPCLKPAQAGEGEAPF
jgi:hypothetical protein